MSPIDVFLLASLVATWGIGWLIYRRWQDAFVNLTREHTEQREVQATIASIVGELQRTADELGEALATRASKLQKLLGDADSRAATAAALVDRLEEAMRQAQASQAQISQAQALQARENDRAYEPLEAREALGLLPGARGVSHATPHTTPRFRDFTPGRYRTGAEGVAGEAGMLTAPASDQETRTTEEMTVAPSGVATIADIRRLAAQGLSAWEIAKRTHRGREEVRLLLELKEQHQ